MNTELVEHRLRTFRTLLSQEELDAIVIANYSPSASSLGFDYNLFYLSGLFRRYDNSFLILTGNGYDLCVDSLEAERARGDSWLETVDAAPILGCSPQEFAGLIMSRLDSQTAQPRPRIGINGSRLRSSVGLALAGKAEVVDISLPIEKARVKKDRVEIELCRRACQIAEAGAGAIISSIREGMTERELAAIAQEEMTRQGAEYMWWFPILVASGPDAISFNGGATPTDRKVVKGDLIHVDICPSYRGYNSDIARTIVMGSPTREQMEAIDIAYAAFESAMNALKAGNTVGDVGEAMHTVIDGSGYESFFMGPGHGMGINDDCYPFFKGSANEGFVFEDGMYMSIEVGAMVPQVGGVRYEDNFIVNGSSPIRLTTVSRLVSIPT